MRVASHSFGPFFVRDNTAPQHAKVSRVYTCKIPRMADKPDWEKYSAYFSEIGKKGAKARLTKLTPEQRKDIATKASKAAARERQNKAKKKRGET